MLAAGQIALADRRPLADTAAPRPAGEWRDEPVANVRHAASRSVTLCGVLLAYVDKSYTRDRYGPGLEDTPGDDAE